MFQLARRKMNNKEQTLSRMTKHLKGIGLSADKYRVKELDNGYRITISTARNNYYIRCTEDYLGCIAESRVARAGENWLRGNDLPDGKFTQSTFGSIIRAIALYEMVPLAKEHVTIAENDQLSSRCCN